MTWQEQTISALGFLAPPDEWRIDVDGDVVLTESDENPGWLIFIGGDRIRMSWGCIDFECDVQRADIALSARWLMAAAAAWGQE